MKTQEELQLSKNTACAATLRLLSDSRVEKFSTGSNNIGLRKSRKKIILSLDCTERNALIEIYDLNGNLISKQIISDNCVLSSQLLLTINKMLLENNLSKSDIDSVRVDPGPGSYTGLRIGLTTANFLALSLNIPINKNLTSHNNIGNERLQQDAMAESDSHKFTAPVLPVYANPPHITKPKSGR